MQKDIYMFKNIRTLRDRGNIRSCDYNQYKRKNVSSMKFRCTSLKRANNTMNLSVNKYVISLFTYPILFSF